MRLNESVAGIMHLALICVTLFLIDFLTITSKKNSVALIISTKVKDDSLILIVVFISVVMPRVSLYSTVLKVRLRLSNIVITFTLYQLFLDATHLTFRRKELEPIFGVFLSRRYQ